MVFMILNTCNNNNINKIFLDINDLDQSLFEALSY